MSIIYSLCSWLGLTLVLAGAVVSGHSLYLTWRDYGDGPFFPRITRMWSRIRRFLARFLPSLRSSVIIQGSGINVSTATGEVTASVSAHIPDEASIEKKIELLIRQIYHLQNDVRAESEQRRKAVSRLETQIRDLRNASKDEADRLASLTRRIAVGDVRPGLLALILVALGTILLAVPTLFPIE